MKNDGRGFYTQEDFWKDAVRALEGILNELKEIEEVLDNMNDNISD